mmetsp:Transcript_7831/g.11440  ORF Transcript_7831/g.11440 Transcript_7831/m.11440 type:complete len:452 (+) Transcript_7831:180-1535(+)|eukprot:CAMPEP_0195526118 /NCGR_PEP_ID=MMETSP0794_2-20130614/26994_1 /TAXON_ID=515487 /ORGANISM="Stephanopyxis turris, Strain CCMP 815" /LENGTH=451 /DNA_ID=CAMNT_0040656735 /DNA_START=170 /DNA_END=1525 /DNA_ORIENTATION=+
MVPAIRRLPSLGRYVVVAIVVVLLFAIHFVEEKSLDNSIGDMKENAETTVSKKNIGIYSALEPTDTRNPFLTNLENNNMDIPSVTNDEGMYEPTETNQGNNRIKDSKTTELTQGNFLDDMDEKDKPENEAINIKETPSTIDKDPTEENEDEGKNQIGDSNTNEDDSTNTVPKGKIKLISLIGERNTGTNWITHHLKECFNHTDIPVKNKLVRYKHWFQHDVVEKARLPDTIVVAMFRSSYYWVESMRHKNYHAPIHRDLDWETFLTTPWTLPERLDYDKQLVKDYAKEHGGVANYSDIECQDNFRYNQVNSCLKRPYLEGAYAKKADKREDGRTGGEPMYELRQDGSGRAYSNILEMRSDKIKNFLDISKWDWVAELMAERYEGFIEKGTASLIARIEELSGVKAQCEPFLPQPSRAQRPLEKGYVEWINRHLDWETEGLIGYEKLSSQGF